MLDTTDVTYFFKNIIQTCSELYRIETFYFSDMKAKGSSVFEISELRDDDSRKQNLKVVKNLL